MAVDRLRSEPRLVVRVWPGVPALRISPGWVCREIEHGLYLQCRFFSLYMQQPIASESAVSLPPTKEEVNAFARVRLSVCLSVSKITQKRVHGFG